MKLIDLTASIIAGAFVLSTSAHSSTLGMDFLASVAGEQGARAIPTYEPLDPNDLEVLDRVGAAYENTYSPVTGSGPNELPESSAVQVRKLSNKLSVNENKREDERPLSNLAVAMFQLIASHEIARSPTNPSESIDIPLEPGDQSNFENLNPLSMDRSQTTGEASLEQLNDITSAFDGSTVYGSTETRKKMLWEVDEVSGEPTGFLLTSKTDSVFEPSDDDNSVLPDLPKVEAQLGPITVRRPIAGDVRADENPTLEALHQLFVLEHNRIAKIIKDDCEAAGKACSGEQIFNATRYLVAETQKKIFYEELLPVFLGTSEFQSLLPDPDVLNTVEGAINEFTAAAGRVGHTQVPNTILLATPGNGVTGEVTLSECFFDRGCLGNATLEEILYGAATQKAEAIDLVVVDSLRNGQTPGFGANRNIDLFATNINRGRDHGIPGYVELRDVLGFGAITSLDELRLLLPQEVIEAYGIKTDADVLSTPIDLIVGLFSEYRGVADYLGETGKALWALQFLALDNDMPEFLLASSSHSLSLFEAPTLAGSFLDDQTMASLLANNLGGEHSDYANPFIAPVPVPPALPLLGASVFALFTIRRLRNQ